MDLIRLYIKGISYSQTQNEAYALILHELKSDIKLPIVIGAFEAQAIAIELERRVIPPRPLTHDLFKIFADTFNIKVEKVVIHKLIDGIFYANMICSNGENEQAIDARTSDAIAIALRFNAPIYTTKKILKEAGIFINVQNGTTTEAAEEKPKPQKSQFSNHTLSNLQQMLNDCIENEDYEMAAKIRDEITKRSES